MQGIVRRYLKGEEGATAVEFAFLSVPFTMFIIGIIEVALMLAHASILEGATNTAARMIRTGQVQQSGEDPATFFRGVLCDHASIMDCNDFQFQVTTLDSFSEAQDNVPEFDDDGNLVDQDFDAGGSGDIVMIRVTYMYSFMTPMIGTFFSNYPGNKRMMMSTIVMQSEPYEFE